MHQSSFVTGFQDMSKVGYVSFHPDQPTVIYTALRCHYILSKAGAVNFMSDSCSLQFEISKPNPNHVAVVHVMGYYDCPSAGLFDLHCYGKNNDCIYHAYGLRVIELGHELCIGLGFRSKSITGFPPKPKP
jgi:hypothetical protein